MASDGTSAAAHVNPARSKCVNAGQENCTRGASIKDREGRSSKGETKLLFVRIRMGVNAMRTLGWNLQDDSGMLSFLMERSGLKFHDSPDAADTANVSHGIFEIRGNK